MTDPAHPPVLPPGVWTETFTYSSGRTDSILKTRIAEEGPHMRTDQRRGVRYLSYMYGHWVFLWPEHSNTIAIAFGTLAQHRVEHRNVPIEKPWNGDHLVRFSRNWRSALLDRLRK